MYMQRFLDWSIILQPPMRERMKMLDACIQSRCK